MLYVAGLGADPDTRPDEAAVDTVYAPHILWRTWGVLVDAGWVLQLPRDLDALVQRVYSDEALTPLDPYQEQLAAHVHAFNQTNASHLAAAEHWSIPAPGAAASEAWQTTASDRDEQQPWVLRAPTRLGEASIAVVPVMRSAAGWTVVGTETVAPAGARRAPPAWVASALDHQVRVTTKRVVAKLRDITLPSWWSASGPLRYMVPLELDTAGRWVADTAVYLDDALGLVTGPLPEGGPS